MGPSSTRVESHPLAGRSVPSIPGSCRGGNAAPLSTRASWGWGSSDAEDMGAGRSGRPGRRSRHRRRGRRVQWKAGDLAAQEPPPTTVTGGKRRALGHGLREWDPDLSGGPGRFAVLRDQPSQRDVHRVARARPGDLSGPGALPGERQPGGVAVWLDTGLSGLSAGATARTWPNSTRIWSHSVTPRQAQLSPTSSFFGSATATAVEKLQADSGGGPERHAGSWPSGVRTHRSAGHEPCQPSSGAAPRRARR